MKIGFHRFAVLAALSLAFCLSASATTIKMVSWAIDESYRKTDASPIKNYLVNNDIDFGVFEQSKASTYFLATSDFKATEPAYVVETLTYGINNYRHIIYRSDRYTLVNDPTNSTYMSGDYIGAVFQDGNGDQYALLSLRGTYKTAASSAQAYIEGVVAAVPSAAIFATSTARLASNYFSVLDTYLTETEGGPKMTCLGKGTVSGFYTYPATVPTTYNVADAIASGATYTGTVCSVTVPTKYRVKFLDMDGATELQNTVVNEGSSVTPPTPPAHQGYAFTGWDHEATTYANVQSNMDITAQYEISGNYHEVTFQDYDGTEFKTMSVEDGKDAVPPDDPARGIAWEFSSWEPGYTNVTEDITCIAQYRQKSLIDVTNAADLAEALADDISATTTIRLKNDIDCGGVWTAIASFVGTLDGNGCVITNLPNDAMLFTTLEGTVENLTFSHVGDGSAINASKAIIASSAKGATISNCTFVGCLRNHGITNGKAALIAVSTSANSEGRITRIVDCTIKNSRVYYDGSKYGGLTMAGFVATGEHLLIERGRLLMDDPDVIAIGDHASSAGAFIAQAGVSNTVVGCYNEGKISIDQAFGNYGGASGIIGGANGKTFVYDCTNVATIVGTSDSGAAGIVGAVCKTTVKVSRCVNRGTVTSAAHSSTTNPYGRGAGGIMGGAWGQNTYVYIFDCANYGAVSTTTNDMSAGGIMAAASVNGPTTVISNCYNYASVYSESCAGGVIAKTTGQSYLGIYNCGNVGDVTSRYSIAAGAVAFLDVQNKAVVPIKGFMQAGAIVGGSNSPVGGVVGVVTNESGYIKREIDFESVIMLGTVSAGDGGQAGALVGGSQVYEEGKKWTFTADENCRVLDATIPVWYDYNNAPVANEGDNVIATMAAVGLKNKSAKNILDAYAVANGHMRWIQGANAPELALFGTPAKQRGLIIFVR